MIFEPDYATIDCDGETITPCQFTATTNQGNKITACMAYGGECTHINIDGYEFERKTECISGLGSFFGDKFIFIGDMFEIAESQLPDITDDIIDDYERNEP